jgi:hypothetical protein
MEESMTKKSKKPKPTAPALVRQIKLNKSDNRAIALDLIIIEKAIIFS